MTAPPIPIVPANWLGRLLQPQRTNFRALCPARFRHYLRRPAGSLDQLPVPLCRCAFDKWDRILVKAHLTNDRSRYVSMRLTHNRPGYVVVRLTQNRAVSQSHSESLSFEYAR